MFFVVTTPRFSFNRRRWQGLLAAAALLLPQAALAGPSPWWEHYERQDEYQCGEDKLLMERNDDQASIYMRGYKTNLFRDKGSPLLKRYKNEQFKLTIRGDVIELEDLLSVRQCQRYEQA